MFRLRNRFHCLHSPTARCRHRRRIFGGLTLSAVHRTTTPIATVTLTHPGSPEHHSCGKVFSVWHADSFSEFQCIRLTVSAASAYLIYGYTITDPVELRLENKDSRCVSEQCQQVRDW